MFERLAGANALEDLVFFGEPVGRNDDADGAADQLGGGVAEDPFRRGVGRLNDAVQVLGEDGIF
jgi:hypothetical protein